MLHKRNKSFLISYINLRRLIGCLGICLPGICFLGALLFSHTPLQESVSYYYYTNSRDLFIGVLIGVSFFLLTYNGYYLVDTIVTSVCGIAGTGIALFPCLESCKATGTVGVFGLSPQVSDTVHFVCATIFFVLLALNSMFLFTLSNPPEKRTSQKVIRNRIYIGCGIIILLSLGVLALFRLLNWQFCQDNHIIFYIETLMLAAFGTSWLIKGETLWKDPKRVHS
jgi:uncharacterized protein YacL